MNARKKLMILLAGPTAALALGSVALGSIPDGNGVIHSCYGKSGGNLRVLDAANTTCGGNETGLTWNTTGPAGPQGPKGDKGDIGPAGPAGPAGKDGRTCTTPRPVRRREGTIFLTQPLTLTETATVRLDCGGIDTVAEMSQMNAIKVANLTQG